MNQVLVKTYTEKGYKPTPSVRLSDEEYGRGLQCFVPACVDIVPIDSKNKIIFLAPRKTKPYVGWWFIGGKMIPSETKEETAARCFERETKLKLPTNRFALAAVLDYRWNQREQPPQDLGCHMLGYTFTVELAPKELAQVRLEENEYEKKSGFTAFNREQLVEAGVFPSIIDLYDHIFPPSRS
ncbi:MAG: hypothetical protein UV22_C0018G0008 [Parcubacteria group bacterium GW2011_GWA2_42_35]|nr:MAG: hypothetical protein UU96_C0014G0007 [Parcubacteria group bacterium GW2011_GWC2_42_13]KKS57654.1 MAG: hypothetical protein UV22_C0018G0008 [Parcubacteria group bacterium GW2011_GWA2_42_35]